MTVLTYLDSLSWDLQNFNSSEVVVLQYVDDILLCAETEEACSRASECGTAWAGAAGFRFPVKWWDSPPPSGNLEPANQYAPSKKQRES